ncbi:uncharacterized protein BO95DRAFT_101984 [Aspergillus brunneoviolaceus CBS 621.78]|uniref:Uncharacterized protein n=1 Tax=Aspergillus brunneoviolaceus CBS 621.78 TaxID=1450534 RepID=A0ACD1GB49_9EURO|nr:hypothetical protein BO95DRAFT_101984 [Aspergillus brunneoviolaceus CBS 621.78]RAH46479.1 hypothetical protein BO95DRAFT_101984 [Aspergillus brunneoviolaceus CBS 621.78]
MKGVLTACLVLFNLPRSVGSIYDGMVPLDHPFDLCSTVQPAISSCVFSAFWVLRRKPPPGLELLFVSCVLLSTHGGLWGVFPRPVGNCLGSMGTTKGTIARGLFDSVAFGLCCTRISGLDLIDSASVTLYVRAQ